MKSGPDNLGNRYLHTCRRYLQVSLDIYIPVAESLVLLTTTVISNDDGLLRISTGCSDPPSFSIILYADSLKDMVMAVN